MSCPPPRRRGKCHAPPPALARAASTPYWRCAPWRCARNKKLDTGRVYRGAAASAASLQGSLVPSLPGSLRSSAFAFPASPRILAGAPRATQDTRGRARLHSDTSPFSRTTPFDGGPNGQGRCHPVLAKTPKGSMAPLLPRRRPSFCRSRLTLSTDGAVRTPGQNQWSSFSTAQSTPAGQPLCTRRSERRPRLPSPPRLGRYSWATARIWRRHTGRLRTACATGGTPARRSSPHASRLTCHAGSRLGSLATCSAESPPWPRRSASDLSPGRQRCNPIRLQP